VADRLPVPKSDDEISRLAVTLNGMLDRLAAARDRQRAFVADAAHELRSPLANLRTALEVAQRHGVPPNLADELLIDVERLSRLVDDLLLLARADDAVVPAAGREPVELRGVVTEVADRFRAARVPVSVVDGGPVWTVGERNGLVRVVDNLVHNAVRHAAGRVVVAAAADDGSSLVTVTDDGPGIPVAERERVFDRFTRLDDARARDAGGAGLGLAIARELLRRQGGTVRLADADPGLCAEVRLPPGPPPDSAILED
jgi:signal transduction histidine kinase